MNNIIETQAVVALDYPQKGETVTSAQYTLRISASPDARAVEVSIDGSQPQPTRRSSGYFWYDWSNYLSGQHEIKALARFGDGSFVETKIRRVRVEIDPRA